MGSANVNATAKQPHIHREFNFKHDKHIGFKLYYGSLIRLCATYIPNWEFSMYVHNSMKLTVF